MGLKQVVVQNFLPPTHVMPPRVNSTAALLPVPHLINTSAAHYYYYYYYYYYYTAYRELEYSKLRDA